MLSNLQWVHSYDSSDAMEIESETSSASQESPQYFNDVISSPAMPYSTTSSNFTNNWQTTYFKLKTIGKSKHKVKLVQDQRGNYYAMKIFRINNPECNSLYYNEKVLYSKLPSHPNIVNVVEFLEFLVHMKKSQETYSYNGIVTEFVPNKDLFSYVSASGGFNENLCRIIFKQILLGVCHMHQHGFAHLDLKLENIFIDQNFNVKVGDFDTSTPIKLQNTFTGTANYIAPEMLEGTSYLGPEIDTFALGVLLFSLRKGLSPFNMASAEDPLYRCIYQGNNETFWKAHEEMEPCEFSEDLKRLILSMLTPNQDQRPQVADILNSTWLNQESYNMEDYTNEMKRRLQIINLSP
jgi:NUAK family SNF1-like kinase